MSSVCLSVRSGVGWCLRPLLLGVAPLSESLFKLVCALGHKVPSAGEYQAVLPPQASSEPQSHHLMPILAPGTPPSLPDLSLSAGGSLPCLASSLRELPPFPAFLCLLSPSAYRECEGGMSVSVLSSLFLAFLLPWLSRELAGWLGVSGLKSQLCCVPQPCGLGQGT